MFKTLNKEVIYNDGSFYTQCTLLSYDIMHDAEKLAYAFVALIICSFLYMTV